MIRGIHYSSTELKTKIDVIPRSCFETKNTFLITSMLERNIKFHMQSLGKEKDMFI